MAASVIGGFIAFAIIVLFIIFFSMTFVRYYRDRRDSELFPSLVTVTGLIFVLSCLALVPVDIFIFSSTLDSKTGERQPWATQEYIDYLLECVTIVYYVLYSVMMIYSFVMIPFSYFFYEEYDEDITFKKRVLGALKYTIFTITIMIVLLLLGFFLSPGEPDPSNPQWYLSLFNASSGIRAVCFIVACLTIMGILVFVTYTAYGLSALPVGLIRGRKTSNREEMETMGDLEATREKQRSIQAKYIGGRKMNQRDKKELEELEKKERLLSRRSNVIEHHKSSWLIKCYKFSRPFQIILGVILLLIAGVIFISILLTSIDRVANSYCGSACGFVLENPKIFNPLDTAFRYMSMVFPIDYVFMVAIFIYFFLATLSGITKIGIRFLWINLYKVRRNGTVPQGLLLTSILLMLALLFVNVTLLTIAPDYAAFGYQKYCNITIPDVPAPCQNQTEEIFSCTLDSPRDKCTQTAFSTLVNRMIVITPFFGTVFMGGHWVFLLTTLLGLVWSLCKRRQTFVPLDSDSESDS